MSKTTTKLSDEDRDNLIQRILFDLECAIRWHKDEACVPNLINFLIERDKDGLPVKISLALGRELGTKLKGIMRELKSKREEWKKELEISQKEWEKREKEIEKRKKDGPNGGILTDGALI